MISTKTKKDTMSSIYSINTKPASTLVDLKQEWLRTPGAADGPVVLPGGYQNLVPVQVGGKSYLYAYNPSTQKADVYSLSSSAPWVQPANVTADLREPASPDSSPKGPWDNLSTFVLGNEQYLLAYRRQDGTFAFFRVDDHLSVSKPYIFVLPRNTPSKGFTSIGPFTSVSQQYILGYDTDTGEVANFSVTVTPTSQNGIPPLLALNVWYHRWAEGWKHFAFFQLGGANFFFKINVKKLNVNIDHIQDNPAMGTIEVGSYLQSQLPDALSIDNAAIIPWANGEPYLLTYIANSGSTAIYRIHADCQGWTQINTAKAVAGASQVVPYRIGDSSFVLFYQG